MSKGPEWSFFQTRHLNGQEVHEKVLNITNQGNENQNHNEYHVLKFLFIYLFLYGSFLLVIYFIHISIYMSIPISQFIPPTSPLLSPLGVHMFVLYICVSISAQQTS